MTGVSKRERKWVLLWAAAVAVITTVPYAIGWLHSTEEMSFTGVLNYWQVDSLYHLSWARQVLDGHLLFEGKYFGADVETRLFFNGLFALIGLMSKWGHVPLALAFNAVRVVSVMAVLYLTYAFAARFFARVLWRRLVLVLVSFSSGFGWLTMVGALDHQQSADLWLIEVSTFWTLRWEVVVPPLVACLLLCFLMMLRYFETGLRRYSVAGGGALLMVCAIHPHDALTVLAVSAGWGLICWQESRRTGASDGMTFKHVAVGIGDLAMIPMPLILWHLYAMGNEPVFREYAGLMHPFDAVDMFMGYGLIGIGALAGVAIVAATRRHAFYFCVIWVVPAFILLFVPISPFHQIYLIHGLHIPLCVLAVLAMSVFFERVCVVRQWRPWTVRLLTAALVLVVSLTSIFQYINEISLLRGRAVVPFPYHDLDAGVRSYTRNMIMDAGDNLYSPNYLPQDIGAAMEWLSNHGTPEDTVAAPPGLAILIPMMAGRRQILRLEDHGGYQESRTKLEWIFDESLDADPVELVTVLKMNRVRYIMLGPTCDPDTKRRYMEHLTTGGAAARVYSNDTVWILEVGGMNR